MAGAAPFNKRLFIQRPCIRHCYSLFINMTISCINIKRNVIDITRDKDLYSKNEYY